MLKKILKTYNKLPAPDYKFVAVLGAIIIFGLIILSSASAPSSFERFGDSYVYLRRQLFFGFIPGLFLLTLFSMINYKIWKKYAFSLLVLSIVLLVLVFVPGIGAEYGSARSWLNIFGLSVQPSEIVKLTFLLYLATWLASRGQRKVGDLNEGLLPFLFILGLVMFLMILQPDIGTMSIIVLMSIAVYFVAGAKINHILALGGLGIVFIYTLIKIAPYRAARLTVFLRPDLDPQGIGYHINQAFLAIGSGGFWGRGFGLSRQKFQYLPEVMGDSIYAILAEELGFVFAVLLVLAFVYLIFRGFKIALSVKDDFAKYVVVGVLSWIGIQAFVNIGAMVGIMPLTGVPLPFVSYGGTALTMSMAAMGIVINISRYAQVK